MSADFRLLKLFFAIALIACALPARAVDHVRVEIEGLSGDMLNNVTGYLTLIQQKSHDALTDERIQKLHKKTPSEIREALQPFGYYKPEIQAELTFAENIWVAHYRVDPGPALKILSVDVQIHGAGAQDSAFQRVLNKLPVVVGETLEHAHYEEAKNTLAQLATERGYLDAQFETSEIRVDLETYTAAIVIHFNTGERYRFGAITFNAPEFEAEFLQRYATFTEGDGYTFTALLDLQNALTDSDYFSQVEVKTRRDLAQNHVIPVEVVAVARERTRYTLGLGYGSDTGARATAGVERRRVTQDGHRWRADAKVSEISDSLSTRYIIPLKNPRTDQFTATAGFEDQRLKDNTSKKYLLSGSISRLANGWQKSLFVNIEHDQDFAVGGQTGSSTLVMPGINWTRLHANDRIYTTFGNRFMVEVRGGSETLGSTTSFIQTRANVKFVRRFQDYGRVLARGDTGYTKVLNFEELPPSVRFFAGGDFSVRGYAFNSLGPREGDKVIGGTHLLVGSLEYEHILTESWSLATFYDAGNAMNNYADPVAHGAGLGVRYRSPIGLIRLDLAQPLDKNMGERRYLHISIGPDL